MRPAGRHAVHQRQGEIFALLGPNGAGKTTLIGIICGIVNASTGTAQAMGRDVVRDYRATRRLIGLVPQELTTDAWEGRCSAPQGSAAACSAIPPDEAHLERVLRDLSLWDKRNNRINTLSGGMKRRVLIAKALAHEPRILFLDEPTAGVDVELRADMWRMVRRLRESGVTIFLTTHYIEEAEQMADRIGIIEGGRLVLVEDKAVLMNRLGTSELIVTPAHAAARAATRPRRHRPHPRRQRRRADLHLRQAGGGQRHRPHPCAPWSRRASSFAGLRTRQSSLQEIFVNLLQARA